MILLTLTTFHTMDFNSNVIITALMHTKHDYIHFYLVNVEALNNLVKFGVQLVQEVYNLKSNIINKTFQGGNVGLTISSDSIHVCWHQPHLRPEHLMTRGLEKTQLFYLLLCSCESHLYCFFCIINTEIIL